MYPTQPIDPFGATNHRYSSGVNRKSRNSPATARRPHRAAFAVLATVTAVLGIAACSGTSSSQVKSSDSGPGPAESSTSTETTLPARDPVLGNGETVTIAFGGDASFENLDSALAGDTSSLLSAIAPVMNEADLGVANLEAALTTGGSPSPKAFNFRVPPSALDALSAGGVQVISQANNHGMDYGQDGFAETLQIDATSAEDHGVDVIGVGANVDEAYAPVIKEVNGQQIAIFAASDVFDSNLETSWTATDTNPGLASARQGERLDRLVQGIAEVRDSVDTVIVYLHMGVEKDTCPTERQVALSDTLHDNGADLVIGTHAHRLQGAGFRDGRFVAYGLGNFVFKGPSAESRKSAVLRVDVTGRRVDGYEWVPATLSNNVPVPLTGASAESALAELDQRRECANLESEPPAAVPESPTANPESTDAAGIDSADQAAG